MLGRDAVGAAASIQKPIQRHFAGASFAAKKRIIYLFMAGGRRSSICSITSALISATARTSGKREKGPAPYRHDWFPGHIADGRIDFQIRATRQGGAWVSDLMPWTRKWWMSLCFVKNRPIPSVNHDPASHFPDWVAVGGPPSMGAWLSYGLGSAKENLPAFVVLISKTGSISHCMRGCWGNGFLRAFIRCSISKRERSGSLLQNPKDFVDERRNCWIGSLKWRLAVAGPGRPGHQ